MTETVPHIRITVGNSSPHELFDHDPENLGDQYRLQVRGGEVISTPDGEPDIHRVPLELGNNTVIEWPHESPIDHLLPTIKQLWGKHSADPGTWVVIENDGDDPARAALVKALLEAYFNIRQPDPGEITALVTNAGLDFIAKQLSGGTASATAVAKWMALTANASAASASDTTLTAEIATGGGGLIRAVATYAHTGSASTYTLTITYTANGSDSLPVTIAKMGVFDAASTGNLVYETLLSATATLTASGDQLTVTETVTI
jgi:hypothetical protein